MMNIDLGYVTTYIDDGDDTLKSINMSILQQHAH